jgi:hypothetical protein
MDHVPRTAPSTQTSFAVPALPVPISGVQSSSRARGMSTGPSSPVDPFLAGLRRPFTSRSNSEGQLDEVAEVYVGKFAPGGDADAMKEN